MFKQSLLPVSASAGSLQPLPVVVARQHRAQRCIRLNVRAVEDDGEVSADRMEELFKEELRRRGLSDAAGSPSSSSSRSSGSSSSRPYSWQEGSGSQQQQRQQQRRAVEVPPQLQTSRDLNSEGLEGLVPRARVLISLGFSSLLAFGPFIAAAALAFAAIYAVAGDSFVHGGNAGSGPPPYIDPQELLAKESADNMVPFDRYRM